VNVIQILENVFVILDFFIFWFRHFPFRNKFLKIANFFGLFFALAFRYAAFFTALLRLWLTHWLVLWTVANKKSEVHQNGFE
jgi:hypothetical protein